MCGRYALGIVCNLTASITWTETNGRKLISFLNFSTKQCWILVYLNQFYLKGNPLMTPLRTHVEKVKPFTCLFNPRTMSHPTIFLQQAKAWLFTWKKILVPSTIMWLNLWSLECFQNGSNQRILSLCKEKILPDWSTPGKFSSSKQNTSIAEKKLSAVRNLYGLYLGKTRGVSYQSWDTLNGKKPSQKKRLTMFTWRKVLSCI